MELEKVVHRLATDASFAKDMQVNPEAALKAARVKLSSDELTAIKSVLANLGSIDLSILSPGQLVEWYRGQLVEWYRGQVVEWYAK